MVPAGSVSHRAGHRQGGERGVVVLVAMGPGGDVDGAGEQVALVVVAPPVGQH